MRSVAALNTGAEAGRPFSVIRKLEKDTTPTTLVQQLLRERSIDPKDISTLAIGIGPGSYTGIRAGVALCLGWIASRDIPVIPIRSDRAVAYRFLMLQPNPPDRVIVTSYAQQESYAVAGFARDNESLSEYEPLRLEPLAHIQSISAQETMTLGIDIERRCPESTPSHPLAEDIARLALTEGVAQSPESVQPIYLREASFKKAPAPRIIPDIVR